MIKAVNDDKHMIHRRARCYKVTGTCRKTGNVIVSTHYSIADTARRQATLAHMGYRYSVEIV